MPAWLAKRIPWAGAAMLLALVTLLPACRRAPDEVTGQDAVAIYQAVIRRVYLQDDTFGGTLPKPTVYLVRRADDSAGDPSLPTTNSVLLSPEVQQGISEALAGLPTTIIWVDSRDQVSLEQDTGRVAGDGVLITLGIIHYEGRATAQVAASIYVANLAAGGRTYVLQRQGDSWQIIGDTGVRWIS